MPILRSICVFCGANRGANPRYAAAAAVTGERLASLGIQLVYGGSRGGLMGSLADAALAAGGRVVGVIPRGLVDRELAHPDLSELLIVDTLHERKAKMAELADAFIALPGGLGTFDEIFEVLSTAQLQVHKKPIVLIDSEGYFAPLQALLASVVRQGFAIRSIENFYRVVATPEAALQCINSWPGGAASTTQGDPRG